MKARSWVRLSLSLSVSAARYSPWAQIHGRVYQYGSRSVRLGEVQAAGRFGFKSAAYGAYKLPFRPTRSRYVRAPVQARSGLIAQFLGHVRLEPAGAKTELNTRWTWSMSWIGAGPRGGPRLSARSSAHSSARSSHAPQHALEHELETRSTPAERADLPPRSDLPPRTDQVVRCPLCCMGRPRLSGDPRHG